MDSRRGKSELRRIHCECAFKLEISEHNERHWMDRILTCERKLGKRERKERKEEWEVGKKK